MSPILTTENYEKFLFQSDICINPNGSQFYDSRQPTSYISLKETNTASFDSKIYEQIIKHFKERIKSDYQDAKNLESSSAHESKPTATPKKPLYIRARNIMNHAIETTFHRVSPPRDAEKVWLALTENAASEAPIHPMKDFDGKIINLCGNNQSYTRKKLRDSTIFKRLMEREHNSQTDN